MYPIPGRFEYDSVTFKSICIIETSRVYVTICEALGETVVLNAIMISSPELPVSVNIVSILIGCINFIVRYVSYLSLNPFKLFNNDFGDVISVVMYFS